jgi:hypothetical protein
MKKCTYCGKEYSDEATVCAIDGQPVTGESATADAPKQRPAAPPARSVSPALMSRLRSLHLYLGCIFAPMLLFFAISGIWQTLGLTNGARILAALSAIHMAHLKMKSGGHNLESPLMLLFVLVMSVAFITTTILGVIMALNYGRSRRTAVYCLAFGVAFPLLLVLIRLL